MPDIKVLSTLCVKCNTTEPRKYTGEINEQSIKDKTCTKHFNTSLMVSNKDEYIIGYFLVGPGRNAKAGAEITKSIHDTFIDVLTGIGCIR